MEPYIIAEAGVNHDGDVEKALALVDVAAESGADCAKFQIFNVAMLTSRHARLAPYQAERGEGVDGGQAAMLERLALPGDAYRQIKARCRDRGIDFAATPFDFDSLAMLHRELDPPFIKIGSGDLTNAPLLFEAAKTGRRLIVSTGMANWDEIAKALGVIAFALTEEGVPGPAEDFRVRGWHPAAKAALLDHVTLLHCTTAYPTPLAEANMAAVATMRERFDLPVGFSDHTLGMEAGLMAVALGACVVEKHFTLDSSAPGPDHAASLEPEELHAFVKALRGVRAALGSGEKHTVKAELENKAAARRSVVAARPIPAGAVFSPDDLALKRPEDGLSPFSFWGLIGHKAKRDYQPDDPIAEDEVNET